jgi:hypothetical protein
MKLIIAQFLSLLFTALALAPALAHLLELPNKIGLAREDYLTVQQIYSGWALLGIVVVGALVSTLALVLLVRKKLPGKFMLALFAFVCLAATQVIFWIYTFPANQQTSNWTVLPDNWMVLRSQWEYSHAASAVLDLIALIALILCVLMHERHGQQ